MSTLRAVYRWLSTAAHWHGTDGIPVHVEQHVLLSGIALGIALAIAVPVGLLVGHRRRGQLVAVSVANTGRAIPSFAVLVVVYVALVRLAPRLAFSNIPTLVALVLLAVPPVLTNTYVGVQGVDADIVEAARGMGMRSVEVLLRIEVPLSVPVILAGIRTAAVTVVATATLAPLAGGGGLGEYILNGFAQSDPGMTYAGAVLVAVLAILTEATFAALQRRLTPRTMSRDRGRRRPALAAEVTA
jgi:osmoprotectant transport system permease protein